NWLICIILVLAGLFLGFLIGRQTAPVTTTPTANTELVESSYNNGYQAGFTDGQGDTQVLKDSLMMTSYKLRLCMGQEQPPRTPTATIASPAPKKKAATKPVVKPDASQAEPVVQRQETFVPPVITEQPGEETVQTEQTERAVGGQIEGIDVSTDRYGPKYSGDFCSTVENSMLIYAMSDTYWKRAKKTTSTPMVDGKPMTLNPTGYWVLVTDVTLTAEMIQNWQFRWSIFAGTFKGNGYSYDMYLPHETIKSLMRSVRGREDGEITSDELAKMGQKDSNIAKGLIGPNLESVKGSDGKTYYGWEFITSVNYVIIR
ncbi:MAG: hypothetical protein WC905_03615, partial [Patescibacteria group bacterium]